MILKLVRRNIAATRGRLALMLLSVVLGVSFVSGSFILADSLRAIFSGISEQAFAGVDAQIRATRDELSDPNALLRFDDEALAKVAALPEVEYAEGGIFAFEQVYTIDADGEPRRPLGPPVITSSWGGPSVVSSFNLVEGSAPVGNQVAIDTLQAEQFDLKIGDTTAVGLINGTQEDFVVSGYITFGDAVAGAFFNAFDLPTMQRIMDAEGQVDAISLNAADGVSNNQLIAAAQEALEFDPAFEVVPGSTLIDEQNDQFGFIIDIIGYVLLGFALAVLFVSIFIIYNTFAILINQRIRQFGLLRSVGATGTQIRNMVLIESLLIGVAASIIGLFGGVAIASLLKWLFSQGGGSFPDGPILFKARTVVIVFALGIGVTVLSALIPAVLAERIPALAALREGGDAAVTSNRTRVTIGSVTLAVSAALLLFGRFADVSTGMQFTLLGIGSVGLFIAAAALSVLFAARAANLIGAPVEALRGLRGRFARDNATRNPRRTSATATALMIGLALVSAVLILQQSLRTSLTNILDDAVAADLFVFEENQGLPFAGTAVERLASVPEIGAVAGVSDSRARIDGDVAGVSGFDVATGDSVLNIKMVSGTMDLGSNGLLLLEEKAIESGRQIGDELSVEFDDGFVDTFTIKGLFGDSTLMGNDWVVDRSVTAAHNAVNSIGFMGATFAEGVDPLVAQDAASEELSAFPQLTVQSNREFRETQEGQINQILVLILGLLMLCIIVAFIGIVNTMVLSVLERTREIGLLRAVGTSRQQLRSMIRWEATIVSIFGALLGVVLGVIIGYLITQAIPDEVINTITIPWVWLVMLVIAGAILGVIAAVFPARRAARMNVLDAINAD